MSRSMPVECDHGTTVDWGDFGPCENCDDHADEDCPNFVECPHCIVSDKPDIYELCGFDGPEDAADLESQLQAEFPEANARYDMEIRRILRQARRSNPQVSATPKESTQ